MLICWQLLKQSFDEFKTLKSVTEVHNLITKLGKYIAAAQILAVPGIASPGWVELGTGSGQGGDKFVTGAFAYVSYGATYRQAMYAFGPAYAGVNIGNVENLKTLMGIPKANIKTINGIDFLAFKSLDGIL